jgi:predicted alpha/beta-hydrolase family hydrolase
MLLIGPENAAVTIALAHGAGAGMDTDFMTVIAEGLAEAGFRVVRFEFPYMLERRRTGKRRPPDREPILRQTWLDVIDSLDARTLVVGGKSMGGRMASLVADDTKAAGLICLGYPFHPRGKPGRLRVGHLEELKTPTLIVQGERDPLGNREEVTGYELSKAVRIHWLPDGDHSFKPRKSSGRTLDQNLQDAINACAEFVGNLTRATVSGT